MANWLLYNDQQQQRQQQERQQHEQQPEQEPHANKNRLYLTNNYSIVSKYSASKLGYFKDELLEDFVENWLEVSKAWRRSPIVNRGYAARLLAVDWIVHRSIQFDKIDCVIVLGSGFDTLSLRRLNQTPCHWIEIDLPQVIDNKCKYIELKWQLIGDEDISSSTDGVTSFKALNLHLISCDLRNQLELLSKLALVLSNIGQRKNVAILNEVCLCYLEQHEVRDILTTIIMAFKETALKLHYIGYEQVKSSDNSQFANVMSEHFNSLGYPLKYFPTRRQIRELFLSQLNFDHITISSMYQIYHNALFSSRIERHFDENEPFDEFEEMDLYLSHYALVTGVLTFNSPFEIVKSRPDESLTASGDDLLYDDLCARLDTIKFNSASDDHIGQNIHRRHCREPLSYETNINIARFGHSACVLRDTPSAQVALISGGFGIRPPGAMRTLPFNATTNSTMQHKRLADCTIVSRCPTGNNQQVNSLFLDQFPLTQHSIDRMHGQTCCLGDEFVLFSGGRQSPIRQLDSSNSTFIGRISATCKGAEEGLRLTLVHNFAPDTDLRWRHRMRKYQGDKVIQVGGLSGSTVPNNSIPAPPIVLWNVSTDKLGWDYVPVLNQMQYFDRHSFGMDMRDEYTFLIFGGLQANNFIDRPVDRECGVLLYDLRVPNVPSKPNFASQCYGMQVHFIDENQFVKLGGISTLTGLPESFVELYDLRQANGSPLTSIPLPQTSDNFMLLTCTDTLKFDQSSEIVSYGGGGNYFTFGTLFNNSHLIHKYA